MEKDLSDVTSDVDVEALMARLHESTRQTDAPISRQASLQRSHRSKLAALQPARISRETQSAAISAEVINQIPLKSRGYTARIEFKVKQFLKWLVHWNTKGQSDFNHSIIRSLGLVTQELQTGQSNFATLEGMLRDLNAHSFDLERRLNATPEELRQVGELRAAVALLHEESDRSMLQLTHQFRAMSSRLEEIKDGAGGGAPFGEAFDYLLFEQQHRGPVSEIKRRQSTYLELFRDKKDVVDLGCGRGEFVELLSENGINVNGVDSNADMVDFCQARGLKVVQADIFEYLTSVPEKKLDGIFIAQVVEHMPPEQILELIRLCGEKLQPGGVIVAETVNTNCPVALSNFYLDPTHVRPVPPEMLKFMFEQKSFEFQTFKFSSPVPDSDAPEVLDLASGYAQEGSTYQDYAVVALRRESTPSEPNATVA